MKYGIHICRLLTLVLLLAMPQVGLSIASQIIDLQAVFTRWKWRAWSIVLKLPLEKYRYFKEDMINRVKTYSSNRSSQK